MIHTLVIISYQTLLNNVCKRINVNNFNNCNDTERVKAFAYFYWNISKILCMHNCIPFGVDGTQLSKVPIN